MKLNINAKELLALHNTLYERFEGSNYGCDMHEFKEGDPRNNDTIQLKQLYGRLRACIIGALSGSVADPFDAWQAR